jgi:hypothetical protein
MTMAVYGKAHKIRRERALAALREGDPCSRCNLPMFSNDDEARRAGFAPWTARLELDHAVAIALGGGASGAAALSHAICNRRHGGRIGRAVQQGKIVSTKPRKPAKPSCRSRRRRRIPTSTRGGDHW